MSLEIAFSIAEQIAPVLCKKIQSQLNPTELQKALEAGIKAAEKQETKLDPQESLFFRSEPDFVPKFLGQFFKQEGVQEELLKSLKNQVLPAVPFLVEAFKQEAEANPRIKPQEERIEPWLEAFANNYFEKTSTYLRFQVAKEDYFEQLANWFDDVKFAGIAVEGQEIERAEKLAQIFVMPDVVEELQSLSDRWLEQEFLSSETGDLQVELLREQRQWTQWKKRYGRKFKVQKLFSQSQSRKLVLLGAPGSGKTTLMSYFAVMLAQKHPEELELAADTDWLPILIRIRDLARQPDISILEYAREFAEKTMSVKGLPAGFFDYWLEDGRALILLDGLDEVAEEAKRYQVVRRIENFLGQFDQNRAIITSRPAGYRRDFFRTEEFPHYQLQPFDDPKIEEFINRWYDSRVKDKAEAERRKDSLRRALDENDRIKLLAQNPLLLTIIALIHRYQALLPKERYKLYNKAVETLLTSWDANKELSNHLVLKYLGLDDLRRLMESLAYWVHNQGSTRDKEGGTLIDRDELIDKLSREIKTLKQIQLYEAEKEAKRFVDFIRDRTGLLNEQGTDYYAFVHKTFQEYLCAQEINYQADNKDEFKLILNDIEKHLHNPHWQEVLLLLIAQQKPNKAAKAIGVILNHGSDYEQWLHRDLLFAGSCLAENPKNLKVADNDLPQEILERLVDLEVSDSKRVGNNIGEQVFQTLCSLNETEFEAQALELLKDKADWLDEERLLEYQVALGEKEAVITTLLTWLEDEDSTVRSRAASALVSLGKASEKVVTALLGLLERQSSKSS
ncbi:MAG: NACHT domain-containing NTPase [Xenococcaceae cyanobacterium]